MKTVFMTTQSNLLKHNGKEIIAITELPKDQYDWKDLGFRMYEVTLETGETITAYQDEIEYSDDKVEKLWEELGDVPFDEEDGELILAEDWHVFFKGIEREEIWAWFDEQHSKGVAYLLNDYVKSWMRE